MELSANTVAGDQRKVSVEFHLGPKSHAGHKLCLAKVLYLRVDMAHEEAPRKIGDGTIQRIGFPFAAHAKTGPGKTEFIAPAQKPVIRCADQFDAARNLQMMAMRRAY